MNEDWESQSDFEDTIEDLEFTFEDLNVEQLKVVQRVLTRITNIKIGWDGSKDPNKVEKPITSPYEDKVKIIDLEVTLPPSTPYYQQLLWYKGTTTMSTNNYVSILDCCVNTQATTTCTPINPSWGPGVPKAWSSPIKKEPTMFTETEKKTNYLSNRLENILYTTSDALVEKFNINEVKPKNTKQAKEWLAAGGLTVTGDDETRYFNVVWNDPAKPRDDAGYKAAYSALHTSYQNAIDTIRIAEPKDGLEALKAFETANLLPN